jgi:predicted nucleotidyltransferase
MKIQQDILAALSYFDMWDYPLTYGEIFSYLENNYSSNDFSEAIDALVDSGLIFQFEKFYCLKNDFSLAIRRKIGNRNANKLIQKAQKVGRILIRFPFVRAVGISGSLSKNFADDRSDIDLFIITEKNRLWIARTFMHLFKKLTFLVNKQHHFCMNYYIDEQQLEIQEKNIYTAIEIATIIPLQGDAIFEEFYKANTWIARYLPNKNIVSIPVMAAPKRFLTKSLERIFNNNTGEKIDNFLMKITAERWHEKTLKKKLNMRGSIMGMAASKHCAKPDPANFQEDLIRKYYNNLSKLLQQTEDKIA